MGGEDREIRKVEGDARWRETPLDYWSVHADPAVLSGQQWVDNARDPGTQTDENEEQDMEVWRRKILAGELFMHPVHDVTYRNE